MQKLYGPVNVGEFCQINGVKVTIFIIIIILSLFQLFIYGRFSVSEVRGSGGDVSL